MSFDIGTAPPSARRTRLIATVGPASIDRLPMLVEVGLDVARINLSHGSAEDHRRTARAVREASASAGRSVGILVDLPGPKLRLAEFAAGSIELKSGIQVRLTTAAVPASSSSLPLADQAVLCRLAAGDRVLLADGAAELRVMAAGPTVETEVVLGGLVRSRQGVSVPAERLPADALGAADAALIPRLLELHPDFVGQSFVRAPADVHALRSALPADVRIVAKIETYPAVGAIASILEAADAIMVARGDLGVELPFERVPLVQKDLVRAALAAGKPSIVATQMLESMVEAARPTRAEAGDVANAILDGADAVMLSGETAVGAYPIEALRAAASISEATDAHQRPTRPPGGTPTFGSDTDARALAVAAIAMADADPDVVGLVCYTHSGRTARRLSSLRPNVPIVAFTPNAAIARSLTLHRGVYPVVLEVPGDEDPVAVSTAVLAAVRAGARVWELGPEDAVVLVQTSVRGGPNALELLRP